jgi:hypothetical protein
MKNLIVKKTILAAFIAVFAMSCNSKDEQKELEAREEAKVGKVYNPEEQGIEHENRDNQFPSSRNDKREGTGLETGAPSDTTDLTTTQEKQPAKP